jgi:hypothetical protein
MIREDINEFTSLLTDHLKGLGSKIKIYKALSQVLPYSTDLIGKEITAYSRGEIYGSSAHNNHAGCLSYEQSRQRRSIILYALGVKEDSDLIRKLREIDPNTEYPPQERPELMDTRDLQPGKSLYQKLIALSPEHKSQVEELVNRLYTNEIKNK